MTTYNEAVDLWEQSRLALGDVRAHTAIKSAQEARRLSPYFGEKQIDEITPTDIEGAIIELKKNGNQRNGEGLSQASLRKAHMHGTAAVNWAIEHDMAAFNPFDRTKRPKGAKKAKATSLSKEDAAYLMDVVTTELDSNMRGIFRARKVFEAACCVYVIIALSTGMRRGEICALNWGDVDDDHISVQRAIKAGGEIDCPKTETSVRRIAIGRKLSTVLNAYHRWQSNFNDSQKDEDPVLMTLNGGRLSTNALEHWWTKFRTYAGFDALRLHDLRHTHATLLIADGVDVKTVQMRLGHSSAMMTLDVYSHAVPRNDMQAAADLDETLMGAN